MKYVNSCKFSLFIFMIGKSKVNIRNRLLVEIPSETKRKMDEIVKRERDK